MRFTSPLLAYLSMISGITLAQDTEWGVWFFSHGCQSPDGYSGVPGDSSTTLTCMSPSTLDANGKVVPGPYTNIVTQNIEINNMRIILWNDTACTQWVTTVDTDGCAVVPEDNHIGGFNIGPK